MWIGGERVADVTTHPQFRPIVDARARIYDMAHDDATREVMSYVDEGGERNAISTQAPRTREHCTPRSTWSRRSSTSSAAW